MSSFITSKKNEWAFPVLGSAIPAGFPSIAEEYSEGALNLNELLIKHPSATFFVRVAGDSMIKAGIFSGDMVIVDRSLTPLNNNIVIARIHDELTIKRFFCKGNQVALHPENPDFEPIIITESMDFEIWGVVTWVIHQV